MKMLPQSLVIGMVVLLCATILRGGTVMDYNVIWDTPSADAFGSMPLGNGDIGVNAWMEPTGDLVFYISKTDAWGDNARLLKVGKVRLRCDPALAAPGATFRQELDLQTGTMRIESSTGEGPVSVLLWVDANHPVIHITAESEPGISVTASIERWRIEPEALPPELEISDVLRGKPGAPVPTVVEPDTVLSDLPGRIGWYHHNRKSVGPGITGAVQGLSEFAREDPLLYRTFGAVITAEGGRRIDDLLLQSPASSSHRFSVYVQSEHPATPRQWLAAMDHAIATTEQIPFARRRAAHQAWWQSFWDRSWIQVTSGTTARKRPLIPANDHPVRVGVDQQGGSRFSGRCGRVSLFPGAWTDAQVAARARQGHNQILAAPGDAWFTGMPTVGDELPDSQAWTFADGLTVEAWVHPEAGGRILDKITPGGSDGFLLDTHPGRSLRLIVGSRTLSRPDVLPAGQWSHVAAVIDPGQGGRLCLFLNGTPIAVEEADSLDDAAVVSRAYALQRYVDACAGRGRYPIKFNGSIFTVPQPGAPGDADYRRWGPGYWWQNTRLPYLSMCAAGDFDLLQPLFRMYVDELLPLCRYRTRLYLGHGGAYYPECIYFWGDVFSETYGWTPFEERTDKLQESGWHKWEWVCGPELVWMMLEYYDHTLDHTFLQERLLPTAKEVLTFFDEHYATDGEGRLVMHPSQAVETWWDCTNPMPEVAGLRAVTARLLAIPDQLTTPDQRAFWASLTRKLPDLPTWEVDGVEALAPAQQFADKRNIENPELYAVFPFRLVSFEKPNAGLGVEALRHRWDRGHTGWRQDDIFMAYLGLAEEARSFLVQRARAHDPGSRFPAFWGPNYDWIPDQDHGGVLMKTLQSMVMQTEGEKIFLLPAWPRDWDVSFKLHAPRQTTLEGTVRGGRLVDLKVTPEHRRDSVILP